MRVFLIDIDPPFVYHGCCQVGPLQWQNHHELSWQVVSLRKLRAAHWGNHVGEGHTLICTTKHRLRASCEGNAATQNIHTYLPMGCGKVVAQIDDGTRGAINPLDRTLAIDLTMGVTLYAKITPIVLCSWKARGFYGDIKSTRYWQIG